MSIDPKRVRFEYVSASEGQKFAHVVTDFVDELKKMGPNPLTEVKA
jgi:F420-non-reducing hydrogenase iron-sulfur subunit